MKFFNLIQQHTIANEHLKLVTINHGASVQKLFFKDVNNQEINVVLGFKNPNDYLNNPAFIGNSIGRYAGRLKKGFTINGDYYPLYHEEGVHLHGGKEGFSAKNWEVEEIKNGENPFIKYTYYSKDGEEGYPGNLKVSVTYKLNGKSFIISYEAETDKTTHLNLTNHNYYNLNGKGSVRNHCLKVNTNQFLEFTPDKLPSGNILNTTGTPYDFSKEEKLMDKKDFKGVDNCFLINNPEPVATLYSESTRIEMKVKTNQPAIVIYTPQNLPAGNYNNSFSEFSSICFEAQGYPDAPNQPEFPSTLLKKGEKYTNHSIFEFDIRS